MSLETLLFTEHEKLFKNKENTNIIINLTTSVNECHVTTSSTFASLKNLVHTRELNSVLLKNAKYSKYAHLIIQPIEFSQTLYLCNL